MTEAKKESPVVEVPVVPAQPPAVVVKHAPRSVQELLILIAAIGVVVVNVVTVYTSQQTMSKVDTASEQSARERADSDKKLDVIHEQTNSNLTGLNDRLDRAYTKIESLEKLLSEEESENKENDP